MNTLLDKISELNPFAPPPESNMTDDGELPTGEQLPEHEFLRSPTHAPTIEATPIEPRPVTPDSERPKRNIDLVNECDTFPYHETHPTLYSQHVNTYYHLRVAAHADTTLGFLLPSVAEVLRGLPEWTLDDTARTLTLTAGTNSEERSAIMASTTAAMRATGHFAVLKGWRNELYPVYGPGKEFLFSIERAASPLFGVVSYGCHMTAYTRHKSDDANDRGGEMQLWVPRRASTKQTYGGMLDNTVAGGLATGEDPFEGMVRESAEEASLPEDLVRDNARACGTVTYFHIRDERAGGETKLLQPEVQYVYDLELPADVVPRPSDDEVEHFYLWDVGRVQEALRNGEFKPNCAVVLLDFFVRHGIVSHANEADYVEIVSRLHRRMEFPTR